MPGVAANNVALVWETLGKVAKRKGTLITIPSFCGSKAPELRIYITKHSASDLNTKAALSKKMSEFTDIVLFDLASRDHRAWSPNPWKTRLVLNYKRLPYTTHWLEYPDIEPTLKSLGVPANPEGTTNYTPYTVPTIRFPDGTYVMDSRKIASALEERYPSPPLHLSAPELAKIEELVPALIAPLGGVTLPKVPRNLLNERSAQYFNETRSKRFGMPLDQFEREKGGDAQWEEVRPTITQVGELLKKKGGPFVLGEEVSYADFILVGLLRLFKRIGEGVYERAVEMEPSLGRLYDASGEWLARDDK
ncbi:MAG: hypothetical protein LQ338_005591 [Usnochroma carphineum]|nr:MAG: hypothetical protein LQ338_005591 [Usnochroma carphineum]